MHYLIYKTTCLVNSKYYIGKHKTKNRDDDYLGSGKLLRAAIKKYGRENFVREIILECSSEEEMNLAEKILVVPDLEVNYNLCPGGQGGFGYINSLPEIDEWRKSGAAGRDYRDSMFRNKVRDAALTYRIFAKYNADRSIESFKTFTGKTHTEKTKMKISKSMQDKQAGAKNSQFGTRWMNDGISSVKVKSENIPSFIENGYVFGRK